MLKESLQPLMLAAAILAGTAIGSHAVIASDHDDGTTDLKTLNTNLTDLFVFNEASHNGDALAANSNVVLVMNVNPRALPQQQYYFHTGALYDFRVHRLTSEATVGAAIPQGEEVVDMTLRLQFGDPDATTNRQAITLTKLATSENNVVTNATTRTRVNGTDAITPTAGTMVTTAHPMALPDDGVVVTARTGTTPGRRNFTNDTAIVNNTTLDGHNVSVFAGLREDPFFFDVEQFFKVRGTLARNYGGASETLQVFSRTGATDFTAGYNVLSIVLRVPLALLQDGTTATKFDCWETVSVRS